MIGIEELATRLGAKRAGSGYKSRCPAHEDGTPSLSISVGNDGRVLLHCHAGCDLVAICDALNLKPSDLFPERDESRRRIGLADLAAHKHLPTDFLRRVGLHDLSGGGVGIPYCDDSGNEVLLKRRTALVAKEGSFWPSGQPLMPYGLDRLRDARAAQLLVIVEGESDCWTLWHHNIPALGVPGASSTKVLAAEHVIGISKAYVSHEPDKGGDIFVAGVRRQLASVGYRGALFELHLDGAKDPSELHRTSPQGFKAAFFAAMAAARPLAECDTMPTAQPALVPLRLVASGGGGAPEPVAQPAVRVTAKRPWRSRSYLTAVDIIASDSRGVLSGKKLEFNEMSGDITFGRQLIHVADVSRIRANIEANFVGGVDKNNNELGLQLAASDVMAAVEQVAHEHPYNPVRDYLSTLKWDGVERLDHVVADILGGDPTEINRILVRKFFVSAAARAMNPGCKVDTVFVLVGPQGARKSGFFEVLAGDWFVDTPIDISGDSVRAYMTMRKAWILEFAELESLLRARDQNSVKAFLSSRADDYVPKHARYSQHVKRAGVIVGTWNPDEQGGFLNDPTGERRYWPLNTGASIDLRTLRVQRDGLWAEAMHIYRSWAERGSDEDERPWWLTDEETALLDPVHQEHSTKDVWAGPVLDWLNARDAVDEVTVQEILGSALGVPKAQWSDRDSKRVQRILRATREWKPNPNKARNKPRSWIRTGANWRGQKDE